MASHSRRNLGVIIVSLGIVACGTSWATPALSAPEIPHLEFPPKLRLEWEIYPSGLPGAADIRTGQLASLKNRVTGRYLEVATQGGFLAGTYQGGRLYWIGTSTGPFRFEHDSSQGPQPTLRYQLPVAIRNRWGQYLKATASGSSPVAWSASRVYEWTVGGGTAGTKVRSGRPILLSNRAAGDTLRFCPQNPSDGANLRWAGSACLKRREV